MLNKNEYTKLNNILEYVKQLEEENFILKDRILSNTLSENTEITRLNFKIDLLERENAKLKKQLYSKLQI